MINTSIPHVDLPPDAGVSVAFMFTPSLLGKSETKASTEDICVGVKVISTT